MNLATEIEFFTHILNLEKCLKDGYAISITRTCTSRYVVFVMDKAKCYVGFEEDPCVIQQESSFAFLSMRDGVRDEVNRFYIRLKTNNLLKND